MKILISIVFFIFCLSSLSLADNDAIKIFEKQLEIGLITEKEFNEAKKRIDKKSIKNRETKKKEIKLIKEKKKSSNFSFIKKKDEISDEDLALLEIYDKKKFEDQFKKYPKEIINFFGSGSNNVSRAKKAGKYMSLEFNRSSAGQARFAGKMIKAMAMYEVFYIDQLRKGKNAITRFKTNKNKTYVLKSDDEKKIRSLISMNNGRKKMREALGMNLDTPRTDAVKKFWYLGDFLEMGEIIKNDSYDKKLDKRKQLLNEYKQKITKLKEKIENEKKMN